MSFILVAEKRALFIGDVIATWPEVAPGWPGLTLDNAENFRSVQRLTDFGSADILAACGETCFPHAAVCEVVSRDYVTVKS